MDNNIGIAKKQRIYARDCFCEILSDEEANDFVEKNHRFKSSKMKRKIVNIGIRDLATKNLLGVAQFCYPRTANKRRRYSVELLRLTFLSEIRVVGGASKLINYYKKNCYPADIFTYQDTTGETTDVYERCGFTLVGQSKKKQYLVVPGKSLGTAKRGEYWSMGEVVRRGPDALLGTSLGEIYREDGSRKSNPELFIEELGWHIEETSGDRVYEWFNPNITFYVYRITASDSNKYYIGVSHVKKANATEDDCLNDGYWGSGGRKLQSWKKKHQNTMEKTILSLFSTKAESLLFEKEEIGDKNISDPNCLNHRPGGWDFKFSKNLESIVSNCEIHGMVKHLGKKCYTCLNMEKVKIKNCEIHGKSKFLGNKCYSCMNQKITIAKICSIHGNTNHQGNQCLKCLYQESRSIKDCSIHGLTSFAKESCLKCASIKSRAKKKCINHGVVEHLGEACIKCIRNTSISKKECEIHGLTKFSNDTCFKCYLENQIEVKECKIHGFTKHRSNKCIRCINSARISFKECQKHGLVKHGGDDCVKCSVNNSIGEKDCPIHGFTKHRGDSCYKCRNAPTIKTCPIHGETKHRGNSCFKCVKTKSSKT